MTKDTQPKTRKDLPTKPSAGASRAAEYIVGKSLRPVEQSGFYSVEVLARAIDRETGMAELLEAAKVVVGDNELDLIDLGTAINRLEQAIAKCEGSK